jgi:hypothetical protein
MQQLELREYPRAEIAKTLSVDLHDSSHFAEKVRSRLTKWGYQFEYSRRAVTITAKPETPKDRLAEIVYRSFGMDIQVNAIQIGCFLAAFTDIDGFATMPWEEKAEAYYQQYNIWVEARTMRGWCHHLIQKGIIAVGDESEKTAWKTTIVKNKKYRERLSPGELNELTNYNERRKEIFAEEEKEAYAAIKYSGDTKAKAKGKAWKETYKRLWAEFGCCYYYCKCFALSAFSEDYETDLCEVYELAQELADEASERTEARQKIQILKVEDRTQGFVF